MSQETRLFQGNLRITGLRVVLDSEPRIGSLQCAQCARRSCCPLPQHHQASPATQQGEVLSQVKVRGVGFEV